VGARVIRHRPADRGHHDLVESAPVVGETEPELQEVT